MSRPDSYMPLYTGNWLRATMALSAQERDAYLLLCIAYWDNGGPIPDNDSRLARIALCTPETWDSIKETVKSFFEIVPDASLKESHKDSHKDRSTCDPCFVLVHKKLDKWLAEASYKIGIAKERSRLGNQARWGKISHKDPIGSPSGIPQGVPEGSQGLRSYPKPNRYKKDGSPKATLTGPSVSVPQETEEQKAERLDRADRLMQRGAYAPWKAN